MSLLNHQSIFTAMLQNGPFGVKLSIPLAGPFSREAKTWAASLGGDPLLKTKYRAVRHQLFDLLNINSFAEIPTLLESRQNIEATSTRALPMLANLFGFTSDPAEIKYHLHDYANTADEVINSLRYKVLSPYSSHIEMSNEIGTTSDPVELLLILFNDHFHQKARFEAKRKLVLMNLAGSIEQRERETDIVSRFSNFIDFLNKYVWSPSLKIGDLKISYLHSTHNSEDFSCSSVKVITEEHAKGLQLEPGEKLTLIKRRSFSDNGSDVPIYVTIRKKPSAAKVLKLLRKNQKNPAAAVDDELGLMAVLNSTGDVKKFLRHLTRSAVKANSLMTLEDISDTLTGGTYTGRATGSSSKTPMLKFFARIGGMRVEFIIHTNRSYLNYMYQREVAHDEYEVKRIFDSGVAEFLFPTDIYHLDLEEIQRKQILFFRKRNEEI